MPKVSVVVPVYNVEKYLEKCIDSILSQSYVDYELILVDDGSTDSSGELCDNYAEKDSRIKVFHKKNKGLVHTRKIGLQYSVGEYILPVDSDDWIEKDMLKYLMSIIEKTNADMILTGIITEDEATGSVEIIQEKFPEKLYDMTDKSNELLQNLFVQKEDKRKRGVRSNLHTRIYKRNLVYNHQMKVDDRITNGEDDACFFPTILGAKSVYVSKKCFYHYTSRLSSLTKDKKAYDLYQLYLLEDILRNNVATHKYADILEEQLNYYIYLRMEYFADFCLSVKKIPLYIVPYELMKENCKIILYGAGVVGKSFKKQLTNSDKYNLVCWVDEKEDILNGIYQPEYIKNIDFDYILLATSRDEVAESMKCDLKKYVSDEERIIWKKPQKNSEYIALI